MILSEPILPAWRSIGEFCALNSKNSRLIPYHRTNFKAVKGLTTAQIDAAWNVFEYQYVQFEK